MVRRNRADRRCAATSTRPILRARRNPPSTIGKSMSRSLRLLLVVTVLAAAGCGTPERGATTAAARASASAPVAVVHASAACGCCSGHVEHLRAHGFVVEEVRYDDPADLAAFKDERRIPDAQRSCHTTVISGYVVEGHMPVEQIEVLLAERPAIDGIALAGMPGGSPGMPGAKTEPWTIWALEDGAATARATH
jgi:hypothetical protein